MIYIRQLFKNSPAVITILTILLSIIPEEVEGKFAYTKPLGEQIHRPRNYLHKKLFGRATTTTTTTTTTTNSPEFSSLEEDDRSYDESLQLPSEIEERFMDQDNHLERAGEIAEEESQIFEKIFKDSDHPATHLKNKKASLSSAENIEDELTHNHLPEDELTHNHLPEDEPKVQSNEKDNKEDADDNFAIMDIPLASTATTKPFQTTSTTQDPATAGAHTTPISNESSGPSVTTDNVSFRIRPSRSASSKVYKKNSVSSSKNKSSSKSLSDSSEEKVNVPAKKRENVPCTCGVFLSSQIQKGSTAEPEGDAVITNELDKMYKCNAVGQKQCQTKCLETLVQHLPNSANILCATVNRDLRKERAYLYIKNCQDKWINTSLTAGKEYCCKKGKPYSCPMV